MGCIYIYIELHIISGGVGPTIVRVQGMHIDGGGALFHSSRSCEHTQIEEIERRAGGFD